MDELKAVFASNLIRFRTEKGFTQAELGEMLNYSDKTVSKWERAESIPDAIVLKKMAEIFGITIDELLCDAKTWVPRKEETKIERSYNVAMIVLASMAGILTLAVLVFVIFWTMGFYEWIVFAAAIPACILTAMIFNFIWGKEKYNFMIISWFLISLMSVIYLALIKYNPWQIFLVLIPGEAVTYFSTKIKNKSK